MEIVILVLGTLSVMLMEVTVLANDATNAVALLGSANALLKIHSETGDQVAVCAAG